MVIIRHHKLNTDKLQSLFENSSGILIPGVSLLYNLPGCTVLADVSANKFHKVWYSICITGTKHSATTVKVISHIKRKDMVAYRANVFDPNISYKITPDQIVFTGYVDELDVDKVNDVINKVKDFTAVFINMNYK